MRHQAEAEEDHKNKGGIDARREREVGALDRAIQVLRQRETELLERQSALIREAGELGDGGPKATIEENIRSLDGEIVTQRSVIDAKLRERSAVLDRFDEDRQRYLQLTSPAARPTSLNVDLDLDADSHDLRSLEEQLSRLTAAQLSAHLLRIERSVLRQERLSIEILSALQKIAAGKGQS